MTSFFTKGAWVLCLSCLLLSCFNDSDDSESFKNSALSETDQNNPNPFIGVIEPIKNIPYNEISSLKYVIELDRWDIPNNKTEPVKATKHNLEWVLDKLKQTRKK